MTYVDRPDSKVAALRKAITDRVEGRKIELSNWLEENIPESDRWIALLAMRDLSIDRIIDHHGEAEAFEFLKTAFERIAKSRRRELH